MIPLSRTARASDNQIFEIDKLIREYASFPKKYDCGEEFRYKFWDYAIALKIIEDNNITEILDIGTGSDISFRTLLKGRVLYVEEDYRNLMKLPVRDNKYELVTCFGILEHVDLKRAFFNKLIKHVSIGGVLLLTTDNESSKKEKKRVITYKDLIEFSMVVENMGYELYDLGNKEVIDYIEDDKPALMSLVLRRVGR